MIRTQKTKPSPERHWSAELFGPTLERLAPEAHKLLKGLRLAVTLWAAAGFVFIIGLIALIAYLISQALR